MTTTAPLAPGLSEAAFQTTVIGYAQRRGWLVTHFRPARTAKGWATPIEGDPGFPDLVLARAGVVLFRELKSNTGPITADQRKWHQQLQGHYVVWRPRDWPTIVTELT